jgi:hypothetical protein
MSYDLKTLIRSREKELLIKQPPVQNVLEYGNFVKYFKIFEEAIIENKYETVLVYGVKKYKVVICADGKEFSKKYLSDHNKFCIIFASYIRQHTRFTYCEVYSSFVKPIKCECVDKRKHFKFNIEFIL